ncbi:MAG: 3-carboxy-cis,cis-muconate cycloisomerase [bacterium]
MFSSIFVPDAMREATSDRAWLQAMLDVEAALAAAESRVGLIPAKAAEAIGVCCTAERYDLERLAREGRGAGNPIEPLVRALASEVPADAARYVHWGATSQDVLDTAAMIVARRALDLILIDIDGVADACAKLARAHRSTLMAGRTLLQQAVPITFGFKAAGWLVAIVEVRQRLARVRSSGLNAQFGGAAGTLASLGAHGVQVLGRLAQELELAEPPVPWHTARFYVADLGAALALASGTLAKLALDVSLLAQTEVGEAREHSPDGRGSSSTMPHKRNPVGATLAAACARQVQACAGVLFAAMAQEHERAVGAWHAEWHALSQALAFTGGAAAWVRDVIEHLEVRPDRMRENLESTGGLLLSEHVMMVLSERLGRPEAKRRVEAACARVVHDGRLLREELLSDPGVAGHLSAEEIDRALDPAGYLGSADAFIERALECHRREVGSR